MPCAEIGRMRPAVEKDVPSRPVDVDLLGTNRVVFDADAVAELVQQTAGQGCRRG